MVENEHYRPPGFMENVALLDSPGACNIQVVNSKKRARLEMSSQTQIRADRVRDTVKQSEILLLKESLKSERETLHKLYIELEEERGASMTAANEAMAMITRLQEEKATVLMEARRYRRVAEEREAHNQEAISLLKEALLTKEDDLLALQDLLNAYRETLMRIESGQQGDQGGYLEEEIDKEELLLLEGPRATPTPHPDFRQKQTVTGIWRTDDRHKEFECHDELLAFKYSNQVTHDNSSKTFPDFFDDNEGVYDERRYEGLSEEDDHTSKGQPGTCRKQGNVGLEDTFCERHMCQNNLRCEEHDSEIENERQSHGHCLEDLSESIFARVKRLEERFEYLRQNQALEYRRLNVACQLDSVIQDDLEPEDITRSIWEANTKDMCNRKHGYCSEPERLATDSVNGDRGEPEEVLKCLSFEKVRMDVRNGDPKQRSEGTGLGHECENSGTTLHRVNDERSISFAEVNDDGGEGVHDVYEVQYEIKRPSVHPLEQDHPIDSSERHTCETGSMDTLILGTLQEADKVLKGGVIPVPNNHAQPEVCTAVDDKLSVEMSLLDAKGNLANEDVCQLQVRLQALESERDFMKEAIDSLRKENKELKVLQELAQQLRELKVDVRRTEAPGQQDPLYFFSFFKGILSFTGLQNLTATERSRCFLHSSSSSNNQEQGGLLDILNKPSKTPRSMCVTRERKVNFNST